MTVTPGAATATDWLSRLERFDVVTSTNDVVAGWLHDGTAEVCVAIADEQSAGRGRNGRTWSAPPGAALLCSTGFRPTYLEAAQQWRLAAIVSLAMADAVEAAGGLAPHTVRLKWPNDLVVAGLGTASGDAGAASILGEASVGSMVVRKLAGVLGETHGAGTADPQAIIGIGVNVDWPRAAFPPELAVEMTSVAELAPAGAVRLDDLLRAFLERLAPLVDDLRAGTFPVDWWKSRQLTNGAVVRLERPDGSAEHVRALDIDPESGALVVESLLGERPPRAITVGEIRHLRLAEV